MKPTIDLDDIARSHAVDREQMLTHIDALPGQLQDAWETAQSLPLPDTHRSPSTIVLCGMGGSAIGGDLVAALVAPTAPVTFSVVRGYDLPAYAAGPQSLVIASSHSGNTEETLSAAAQAQLRGARILVITTGGELAAFATAQDHPLWRFAYNSQPRAALGWGFGLLVGLAHRLGLAPALETDISEAIALLRARSFDYTLSNPEARNRAKQVARQLTGRIPVCFGSGIFEPVARRWKGQFNENAKVWAQVEPMPEANHNAVASVQFAREQAAPLAALFITSPQFDHPRVALRNELTQVMCADAGFLVETFQPQGQSALAQMCHAIQFGDYVSYYTALLYAKDPTAIAQIVELKAQLAARQT